MSRSHTVARNAASTLAAQVLSWALTIIVTLYLPAYLKDVGLGVITLVMSLAGVCSVLLGLGTQTVLVKEVARNPQQALTLARTGLALRLLLVPPVFALGYVAAWIIGYSAQIRGLVLIALVVTLFSVLNDALACVLRGLNEFKWANLAALLEKLVTSVLTIALVFFRAPLWSFVAVGTIGGCVFLWLQWLALLHHVSRQSPATELVLETAPLMARMKILVRESVPYLTNGLFTQVYGNAAPLLLGRLSSVAAVGWFGLTKRLAGTALVIPVALTQAMLPTLARLYHEDADAFQRAVQQILRLTLVCAVPLVAILVLAPGPLLDLLHYPPTFRNAIPVLMAMGGALLFWFLSQVVGTSLVAADRQKVFSIVSGIAALVSLPLTAVCILATEHWMANGAVGAMVGDALLELGMVAAYLRAMPAGTFASRDLALFLRAVLAATPIVAALYFAPLLGKVAQTALPAVGSGGGDNQRTVIVTFVLLTLGLVLYVPLCIALRALPPQDAQLLLSVVLRKKNRS